MIGARAFDLLLALLERCDRILAKSELIDLVWPVVEENNLQVHVSALRKLLGAEAIATVAGRGYRFTARLLAEAKVSAGGTKPAAAADEPAATADPLYRPRSSPTALGCLRRRA